MSLEKYETLNALEYELTEKKKLYDKYIKEDKDRLMKKLTEEFKEYFISKGYTSEEENNVSKNNLNISINLGPDMNNSLNNFEGTILIKTHQNKFEYKLDVSMSIKPKVSFDVDLKAIPKNEPDKSIYTAERDLQYFRQIADKEYTTVHNITLSKNVVPKLIKSEKEKSNKVSGEDLKELLSKMEL